MFLMITFTDGRVMDSDIEYVSYCKHCGDEQIRVYSHNDKWLKFQASDIARIEWYPSREAALVDGSDLRDYPALK